MPFEKLSGDYNRGYTKAIQDIIEIFDCSQETLKLAYNKSMMAKLTKRLLRCCLENRANIRDCVDGGIAWNPGNQDFKWINGD